MAGIDKEKIDRYFKGESSEDDSSYVDEIFCDNSRERELKSYLSGQFDGVMEESGSEKKNLDHILYRIHYDINTRLSAGRRISLGDITRKVLQIAGIMLLPVLLFIGIETHKETGLKRDTWVEVHAPAWTRAQFSLPDGTTGWLNSNSSIRYNGDFNSDRQVSLKGEAFFDVYRDSNRPFIVNTNEVFVKVLGTRFNIASYENEKNVEVTLEEGSLIFNDKGNTKSYTMKPNDLVIYDKTHNIFITEVVQPQKYLSWTEGKLVFRNDPLDVIARRLERWYNIDVEVKGNLAEDFRLRATFVGEGLEEVLGLLKRSLPINYRIENGTLDRDATYTKKRVIITPKNI